jgi:cytochrome c peroxidase
MGQDSQPVSLRPEGRWTGRQVRPVINRASCIAFGVTLALGVPGVGAQGSAQSIDPSDVRAAAQAAGLGTLAEVPLPLPDLRAAGILNPDNPDADLALLQLGKALFWDQQVDRDGQACASCHFHAGADNRTKNQLNPNTRNVVPDPVFGHSAILGVAGFPDFGPNYSLAATDFPFHVLADPEEADFDDRVVLRDTNDVASSQAAFKADFGQVTSGASDDAAIPVPDDVFNVAGINTRRVAERNAPTVINAVFNHSNLWDGRAHNTFNGVSVAGPLDAGVGRQGKLTP